MIALIHIYCSTSLCVIYKSLLIHDIQVLIYRGSTNERLSGEGVAYNSYYNETDCVTYIRLYVPHTCHYLDNTLHRGHNSTRSTARHVQLVTEHLLCTFTCTIQQIFNKLEVGRLDSTLPVFVIIFVLHTLSGCSYHLNVRQN